MPSFWRLEVIDGGELVCALDVFLAVTHPDLRLQWNENEDIDWSMLWMGTLFASRLISRGVRGGEGAERTAFNLKRKNMPGWKVRCLMMVTVWIGDTEHRRKLTRSTCGMVVKGIPGRRLRKFSACV